MIFRVAEEEEEAEEETKEFGRDHTSSRSVLKTSLTLLSVACFSVVFFSFCYVLTFQNLGFLM